jgi:type IV secretory pathway VirB4 component
MADAPLDTPGVVIGRDALGRVVRFDPFQLYQAGRLHGPNMLVLGDIGYGKSALVKLYLYRQALFGYVPLVTDVKGEYDRLCSALGVTPIRFARGGQLRLNPLDEAVAGGSRLALLRSIGELLLGRSLRPREDAALELAWKWLEQAAKRRRQPTVGDVVARLLRPDSEAAAGLEATLEELVEWGRDLAFALRRLVSGDLAGLFEEPTSPGLALDGPMVSINLSQIPDQAKPILMACVGTWLRRQWARTDGTRRIVVQEEAWHLLASPGVAELAQANFKLARQYGVQNILVMHHLGDLRAAGDAGTRTAELAAGLLADTATRVLYHLDPGEVHASADLLGLNQAQRQVVPQLQRGSGLWLVGQRSYVVHHLLATDPGSPERWIVDTDDAMLGTANQAVLDPSEPVLPQDVEGLR